MLNSGIIEDKFARLIDKFNYCTPTCTCILADGVGEGDGLSLVSLAADNSSAIRSC